MPVRRCDGTTARAAGSDDARRVVARVVAQAEARAEAARAGPEDALAGGAVAVAARSAAVSIHGRWARGAEQRWPRSAAAVAARARGTLPTRTCSLTVVAAASPRLQ